MTIETATLTYDEMGITVDLPTGWTIQADEDGRALACVAEDDWDDDGLAASITIERQAPLTDDDEVRELAATSLHRMQANYAGFDLLHADQQDTTVTRVYEFEPDGLGRRVRQVQGLVADVGLWVVHGTAPLPFADVLQPLFLDVIASLRRDG